MFRSVVVSCFVAAVILLGTHTVFAMPANPAAFDTFQPDGSKIRLRIRGDEWFHWHEDLDGYTVVRDNNGRYAYAQLNQDNRLAPTPLTVGIDNPKARGLQKRILPPASARRPVMPQFFDRESESQTAPQAVPPSGTVKNLVILCKFSDHTEGDHTRAQNDYDVLFNQIGGDGTLAPTGSVKDLYLENSYGVMTLQSTVVGWVTLPHTEAYYADGDDGTGTYSYPNNAQGMVEDALNLIDPLIDFSQFDNDSDNYIDAIDIIHSGYGAETGGGGGYWIWSHRWSLWALPGGEWTSAEGVKVYDYHTEPALWGTSGTNIVRFGVIAHETGHFFGLPDLYDTNGGGQGIGSWGLMANSWGFDNTQLHPPHFCGWSKIFLDWITPTVINTPGIYTIDQYTTNPQVYRIDAGYPSEEYLLIENRQPTGIESAIPQGGLCIFHIDDTVGSISSNNVNNPEGYPGQSGWPENGNHYRVAVLQADGTYDLEKGYDRGDRYDVYRAGGVSEIGPGPGNYPNTDAYQGGTIIVTDNRIHEISAAGSTMGFTFGEITVPLPPVASDVSKATQLDTPVTITLDATDDGLPDPPAAMIYIITSLPSNGQLSDPGSGVIGSVPYTLVSNGNQVIYTPDAAYVGPDSFYYKANDSGTAPDGGDSNTATVSIDVTAGPQAIYSADMDLDPPDWTYDGEWAWGVPTGDGGSRGNPDPSSGYTGSNVVGYDLSGDYGLISSIQWATTPAIDCSNTSNVTLSFYRWLNVESPGSDHVYIQVNNGTGWVQIWENDSQITDNSWTLQTFDISAIADNQPTVYIRWGLGPTNWKKHYSGWNIDDVEVSGILVIPQRTLTTSSTSGGSVSTPGEGTYPYNHGTVVDITATQDLHYHFVDWTGTGVTAGKVANPNADSTTVTMDDDYTVHATFAIDTFTLDYTAGAGGSITGDTSQVVDYGSDGTIVTAVPNTGYHFVQWSDDVMTASRTDTNVTANISVTASFAANPVVISGHLLEPDDTTAIEGILIETSNTASSDVTDPNGYYELVVDYGWSGTVEPNAVGYLFDPNETDRTLTNVTSSTVLDLTGYLETFIIFGQILEDGSITPIEGVTVTPENGGGYYTAKYDGGGIDVTDANGFYEVWVDYDWSGKVVPSKYAYAFEPNGITYANVMNDVNEIQDYAGTLLTYTISGTIKNPCELPIEGVLVETSNGGSSDVTDPNGTYEIWIDYNWSGTVTPTKENYTFDPNMMAYTDVIGDAVDQGYLAMNIYDLDYNCSIGLGDLTILCQNWLQTGPDVPGDFYKDEDDVVNLLDFTVFGNAWGEY